MVSADTRSPSTHDPDAAWLDLSPGQRRALPLSLAYSIGIHLASLVVLAGTIVASRALEASIVWTLVVVAAHIALGTLSVPIMVVVTAPQMLTRQGVLADRSGLTLVQDAKWWFAGRRLHLPWRDVWSAASLAGAARSRRTPRTPNLALHLREVAREAKAPYWAILVPAGAAPHSGGTRSDVPRVLLTLPWDDHDAFLHLVETARPARGRHQSSPADTPPEPADTQEWVPLRAPRVTQWGAYCAIAVGGPLVLPIVDLVERFRGGDGLPAVMTLPMVAVGVCGVLVLVALAPRFWTRQGVDLTDECLRIVQRPLWWHRGRGADIPWRGIHHIVPGEHPVRETPMLEVFLYRADHGLRLPRWARLVLPGEALWGRVTSLPRVVLDVVEPTTHDTLESALRRARSDLFEPPPPATAQAGSPSASTADPAAVRENADAHWVNVRGRRIPGWSIGLLVVVCANISVLAGTWMSRSHGGAAAADVLVDVAAPVTVTVVIAACLVAVMPRLCSHQGVAVGDEGITLVQEPLLWFTGRTVHVPWSQVHEVQPETALTIESLVRTRTMSPDSVVDLVLHAPDTDAGTGTDTDTDTDTNTAIRAPSWVRVHPRQPRFGLPWHRRPDRIRLAPGHHRALQVVQAVRAVRPDLVRATSRR